MTYRRKFSLFISSTYEDLQEERHALMGVALENNFIPVGMEQFHATPASQWEVITKMIDECDFFLLVIGGRYGSLDMSVGKSYTEKEYDYAKGKKMPVLVFIWEPSSIPGARMDDGDDRYEKQKSLDLFREKVKKDSNTVDFFSDINGLKYVASQTLTKAVDFADERAGWVKYGDVVDIINAKVVERNKLNSEYTAQYDKQMEDMKNMLIEFGKRINDMEKTQITWEEIPVATRDDIDSLFTIDESIDKGN